MNLESWNKTNMQGALIKATERFIIILFFSMVGSMILPESNLISKYNIYIKIVIIVVALFEFYRSYTWFKKRLDCKAIIRETKNNQNPFIYFKMYIVEAESQIEINQKRIDFCKILFPAPFLTYWFGIYLNQDEQAKTLMGVNILGVDMATGLFILSFIIIITYVFFINKYFNFYIDYKYYLTEYKKALIECESKSI
ncbi:hypothetical protein [Anaerotignum propionicum]|uniref:hypothetical protein n=1 Tax=Anaerotignum propionicum TaxID=28446 RepID=UPI0021099F54|nr:hypothetical protein [Anaerotignum propionicum]MCQ4936785.1 hypothetical protein [Anaerotignum propionicum]